MFSRHSQYVQLLSIHIPNDYVGKSMTKAVAAKRERMLDPEVI
jgi:hypothetical protein